MRQRQARIRTLDMSRIGSVLTGLSMWLVAACACWIVAVMKGPQRSADSFPPDAPRTRR